jgi:hypothetical protein
MIRINTGFYIFDRSIITFFYKKKYNNQWKFVLSVLSVCLLTQKSNYTSRGMVLCIGLIKKNVRLHNPKMSILGLFRWDA